MCECGLRMGRTNPCEKSGSGAHAQLLVAYLRGMGGGRPRGMHLCGNELALTLTGIYVHACCFRWGTSAQGSGDQQKQVSAGGYVRCGRPMKEAPLVDSACHQMTYLEGPGAPPCSLVKMRDRSSGSSPLALQYFDEMRRWCDHLAPENPSAERGLDGPKSIRGFWCCSSRPQGHHREGDEPPNPGPMVPQPVS